MRVNVTYTVDVTDAFRRQLRLWEGRKGLARRGEIRDWMMAHGLDHAQQVGALRPR